MNYTRQQTDNAEDIVATHSKKKHRFIAAAYLRRWEATKENVINRLVNAGADGMTVEITQPCDSDDCWLIECRHDETRRAVSIERETLAEAVEVLASELLEAEAEWESSRIYTRDDYEADRADDLISEGYRRPR